MRRAAFVVAFLLAGAVFARGKNTPPAKAAAPVPRGIVVTAASGGERADARLEGRLVGWTLVDEGEGRHVLVALAGERPVTPSATPSPPAACTVSGENAPSEAPKPKRLVRVKTTAPGTVEMLRDDIPGDTIAIGAFDSDGDGRDEIVLFRPGRVEIVAPGERGRFGGEIATIVDDPEVGGGSPVEGLGPADDPGGPRLRLPVIGALRTWAPDPSRPRWRTVSDAPTPFTADPGAQTLRLTGPKILPCGRDASGRARFVSEAEAVGPDRLRARLLDPEAPPEGRSEICWAKLPGPERVLEQACLILDGTPHLVVTTMSSEKLGLFDEKRLRVFPLSPDRSRTGAPARFAAPSGMNLWQPTIPVLADADRDGRPDLVFPYWKGLKGSTAVLEVYLRKAEGGFDPSPRRTEIDVDDGEKNWIRWGADADGDGRPDLLLFSGKSLLLYSGVDSSDGRRLVGTKPAARLPWPEDAPDLGFVWSGIDGREGARAGVVFGSLGIPAIVDLDGDGRVEVILAGNDADGGRVIVFSFPARVAP